MSIFLLTAWLLFWRASISGISGQSSMAVASGFSRVTNSLSFKFLVDDIHWQASTILEGFCNSIWENFFSCLASHLSYRSRSSAYWNLKKNCVVVECSTSSNVFITKYDITFYPIKFTMIYARALCSGPSLDFIHWSTVLKFLWELCKYKYQ